LIQARAFLDALHDTHFGLVSGVPCSRFAPLINAAIDDSRLRYVAAANEGDAIAIAAGAELGGSGGVAMLQNSGLGNAVNPLTSLIQTFGVPILLVITHRGRPDGPADEPQHVLMGRITLGMLDLMEIPWAPFPDDASELQAAIGQAVAHMRSKRAPFAFVIGDPALEGCAAKSPFVHRESAARRRRQVKGGDLPLRAEVLEAIRAASHPTDAIIASTGYCGRDLYALGDAPSQLYMVGSMGCAASLGLGVALAREDRRVIVIDGDGAVLMRMGALATVGFEHPSNLVHIVLDNGRYESTGGQETVSGSIDLPAIAAGCGYATVLDTDDPLAVAEFLGADGPAFARMRIQPGVPDSLPRPSVTPLEVAARFRAFLSNGGGAYDG
jgi:phosphonopyruvate decarboxylase